MQVIAYVSDIYGGTARSAAVVTVSSLADAYTGRRRLNIPDDFDWALPSVSSDWLERATRRPPKASAAPTATPTHEPTGRPTTLPTPLPTAPNFGDFMLRFSGKVPLSLWTRVLAMMIFGFQLIDGSSSIGDSEGMVGNIAKLTSVLNSPSGRSNSCSSFF